MRREQVVFWSLFSVFFVVILAFWLPGFVQGIVSFQSALHQETKQPSSTLTQQLETSQYLLTKSLNELSADINNATSTPSQ